MYLPAMLSTDSLMGKYVRFSIRQLTSRESDVEHRKQQGRRHITVILLVNTQPGVNAPGSYFQKTRIFTSKSPFVKKHEQKRHGHTVKATPVIFLG